MGHLLYLMFRCDFDVMENLKNLKWWETKHSASSGVHEALPATES